MKVANIITLVHKALDTYVYAIINHSSTIVELTTRKDKYVRRYIERLHI